MSKSKKILYISILVVIALLIVCTFLSKSISEKIMPKVEVMKPARMELPNDGAESEIYDRVIPASAIITGAFNQKYVYIARERKGLFGPEYYAVLLEVAIIADDNLYVAIGGWNVSGFDDVVISSSKGLTAGDIVKVINK